VKLDKDVEAGKLVAVRTTGVDGVNLTGAVL
jgi:hypothetical protein